MDNLVIRRAEPRDFTAMVPLIESDYTANGISVDSKDIYNSLSGSVSIVAEINDAVLGCFQPIVLPNGTGVPMCLAVNPSYGNPTIVKKLMQAGAEYFKSIGVKTISLFPELKDGSITRYGLYSRLGFTITAVAMSAPVDTVLTNLE